MRLLPFTALALTMVSGCITAGPQTIEWELPDEVLLDYRISDGAQNRWQSEPQIGQEVQIPSEISDNKGHIEYKYSAATGETCWMVSIKGEGSIPMCKSKTGFKFSNQIISGTL